VPADRVITTRSSSGISASADVIANFLEAATAGDLVDDAPVITTDVPDLLPLGTTVVTFTATDGSGNRATASAMITVVRAEVQSEVPENQLLNRLDVNGDGQVTARDALNVINELSRRGGELASGSSRYDVNNDGVITALDALMVINRIPQQNPQLPEGEAVSEQSSVADSIAAADPVDENASINSARVIDQLFFAPQTSDFETDRFDWSIVDAAIDQMF